MKNRDLTTGSITGGLWAFAVPLMLGNIMQQLYNLADTWIVGRYVGDNALAAVGSSYTLITFLTSVIIGLSLGTGTFISIAFGKKRDDTIRNGIFTSGMLTAGITLVITALFYIFLDPIIVLLQILTELSTDTKTYLAWVFIGFFATFIYNFFSNILRGMGNSTVPLIFLGISVMMNIGLDMLFIIPLGMGIAGAAIATVISQYCSAIGILLYFILAGKKYIPHKQDMKFDRGNIRDILSLSGFTCLQQSVMNFGILMIQGLVNSFGSAVMAAFAVAVKIDTIAYMPVQDFGNAFSVFTAQNFGAGKRDRIKSGIKQSLISVVLFCVDVSTAVFFLSEPLMSLFCNDNETIAIGTQYLRTEGLCYVGIGILFMLYGYYRAVNKPLMSVILTVFSLGTRVLLAYTLSPIPTFGVMGIWISIPIGWFLADAVGAGYYMIRERNTQYYDKQ